MSTNARAWLRSASPARVLHIFDDVCNLIHGNDEILSLVNLEIGDGPFSIVLSQAPFPELVSPSSTVSRAVDRLTVGDLSIDVTDARVWNPLPDWRRLRSRGDRLEAGLQELIASIKHAAPAESLAGLLVNLPGSASDIEVTFLRQLREPAGKLIDGLRNRNADLIHEGVAGLVGLGGGLTPAGDDWIMGCLLGGQISLDKNEMMEVTVAVEEAITTGTTPLSAASIRAAARGECGAAWHDLIEAIELVDAPGIRSSAERILSRGHTSGADMLAGFVAVLGGEVSRPFS